MSKFLKIKNEKLSDYLGTDNSVYGLEKTVENGQTRLALEVIVDVINDLVDKIVELEAKLESPVADRNNTAPTTVLEEKIVESDLTKKTNTVKEKVTIEETSQKQ